MCAHIHFSCYPRQISSSFMLKKLAFSGVGLLLLATPLFTSALTVQEQIQSLQTLLQGLLAQITALSAETSGTVGSSSSDTENTESGGSAGASSCVSLSNNLSIEDTDTGSNGEVTRLQQFLVSQGASIYPEALVTGYFGPATERAVKRFQAAQGIVSSGTPESTGYGAVGPSTRAKIRTLTGCATADTATASSASATTAQTCNPQNEMQRCAEGNWAARIGPNCSWAVCSPTATQVPVITINGVGGTGNPPDMEIAVGAKARVSWSVTPASGASGATGTTWTTCRMTGNWNGSVPVSGPPLGLPLDGWGAAPISADQTYTLTCTDTGGNAFSRSTTVTVGSATSVTACPTNAASYRGTSAPRTCSCSQADISNGGAVWGDIRYTDDSNICRSAVHIGAIPATGGNVTLVPSADCGSYRSVTRNGITSSSWGAWPGSYSFSGYSSSCTNTGTAATSATGGANIITSFAPLTPSVSPGSSPRLTWSLTPAASTASTASTASSASAASPVTICSASDGTTTNPVPLSGSSEIGPVNRTTTFSVTCTNSAGTTSKTLRINVGTQNSGTSTTVPNISATPTSGTAPLAVTFSVLNSRGTANNGIYYTITFGDGQAGGFPRSAPFTLSHTYTSPGTYAATITEMTQCSSWECIGPSSVIQTVSIAVGASPTITFSRSPVSLSPGQSQTVSWSTARANSLSYYCTGTGPNANRTVPEVLQRSSYTSSWDTIYNTWGWKGAYSCTWTASGAGGATTYTDNFSILATASSGTGTGTAATATGPTVNLTQSIALTRGEEFSVSWNSQNADSCTISHSSDGLNFTNWKSGTSGTAASTGGPFPWPFLSVGTYTIKATCTANGNPTPAVDRIIHTVAYAGTQGSD